MSRSSHKKFKRTVRKLADAYVLAFGMHEPFGVKGGFEPGELEFHEHALSVLGVDYHNREPVKKYFREMRIALRVIEYPNIDARRKATSHAFGTRAFADSDAFRLHTERQLREQRLKQGVGT